MESQTIDHSLKFNTGPLRELLAVMSDGYLVTDRFGVIHSSNAAAATLLRISQERLRGQSLARFIAGPENDASAFSARLVALVSSQGVENWELQLQAAAQEPFQAAVTVMVASGPDGLQLHWLIRNATGHGQAEESLQATEERFHLMADFSREWEYWTDPNGNYRYCSPACEQITGHPPAEFLQDPGLLLRIVHPEDRPIVEGHRQQEQEPSGERSIDFRIVTQRGEERWINHVCQPVLGAGGAFLGWRASNRDVTERKAMEQDLRRQRDLAATVISAAGALIVLLDRQGRIVRFNQACQQTTGFTFEQVQGKPIWDLLLAPEEVEPVRTVFRKLCASGVPSQHENDWLTKDGRGRRVAWSNTVLCDADGEVEFVVGIGVDITEQRQAEAERGRLLARVQNDREAVRELAGDLVRERDLLQTIMENTQACLAYLDCEFNFVRVNSTYAQESGHTREELLGYNHFALFPNEENQAIFEQVRDTGQPVVQRAKPFEYIDQPERGVTYWDWTLTPIKDTQGSVKGLVLSLLDVTRRVRAEQEREREEESRRWKERQDAALAALYKPLVSPFTTIDQMASVVLEQARHLTGSVHGYVSSIDPVSGDNIGHTLTEMLQGSCQVSEQNTRIVFARGTDGCYPGLWGHVLSTRQGFYTNNPETHPASSGTPGGHIPLRRFLSVPVLLGDELVGQIALSNADRDYRERDLEAVGRLAELYALSIRRWRWEQTLRKEREFFTNVIESLTHPFYVVDADDYTVQLANTAAHGGTLTDNATCYALTHGQTKPCATAEHPCLLDTIKRTKEPATVEHVHYAADGNLRYIDVHGYPLFGEERKVSRIIEYALDVTERKQAEEALQKLASRLGQRIKELDCLYGVSRLSGGKGITLEEILQGTVELIPPAFQYPEVTCSRVIFEDGEFRTRNFEETRWKLTAHLVVHGQGMGSLDVYYLEERPEQSEGPFLPEERDLIDAVAERLGRIAERMRAEAALRLSEKQHRQLVETLHEGIWQIDRDARTTFVNPRMAEMLGYTVEEMQGRHVFAFMDERGARLAESNLKRRQEGIKEQHDFEFLHQDGSRVYASLETSPLFDEDGNYAGALAGVQDVTDRQRVEKVLQKSEALLKETQRIAKVGGWELDLMRNQLAWTEEMYRIHEVPQGFEPELESALSFYAPEDRPVLEQAIQRAIEAGEPWDLEQRFITAKGTHLWVRAIGKADREDGRVVRLSGTFQDVTERKQIEQALRRAHDELELRVQERTRDLIRVNEELLALSQAESRERQLAEALVQATIALSSSLDLDSVLNRLLDHLAQLVPYDSASVLLSRDLTHLAVRATRGYERWLDPKELLTMTIDIQASRPINQVLTGRTSLLIADTRVWYDWQHPLGAELVHSWLGVPLLAGDRVIGLCGLDKIGAGFFTPQHVQLIEALVGQAAVAVQNAWLFEQVRAGRERLQSLSRRLVEVQETERRYIARELHDEAGQALTSLMVGLRLLEREAERPEAVVAGVAELKRMAEGVLGGLHRLAMNLRPVSLDHLGLTAALRQYLEAISDRHGLVVQFEAVGLRERLPLEVATALYRIVQEALTNVIRHAQATRVDVLLKLRGDRLILLVEDNGVGFDPATSMQGEHLGLLGLRERAEMLGGELVLESAAGAGTTLLVEVPYGDSDPHRR